jgi:hypothetical protein
MLWQLVIAQIAYFSPWLSSVLKGAALIPPFSSIALDTSTGLKMGFCSQMPDMPYH